MWEARQSVLPKTLDIYIYSDVAGDALNLFTGEETKSETSANHLRETLEAAGEITDIHIYINSRGGSVQEGLGIYNQLKRHQAYKTVYIDGYACSIASAIAMAGDKVIMPRNTLMMIHNASLMAYGNAVELRKAADELDVISKAVMNSYLMKAGDKLSEDKLKQMLDAGAWLTAEDCLSIGLADCLVEEEADLKRAQAMFQDAQDVIRREFIKEHEAAARLCQLPEIKKEDKFKRVFSAFYKEAGNEK